MDPLDLCPVKILGYSIKSRWQISLNYLIPCTIELLIYLCLMCTNFALIYQHFVDKNYLWAWATLAIIPAPAVICFICVMLSSQWPEELGCGIEKWKFFARQLLNLLFFPICAIYRFSRKIFWCIDSLFYEKNTYERHHAIAKAAETSPFELYTFLQSFFDSAPQIILQLFILLRENMFRNYDTAFVQAMSIAFGLVKMAMTVESYQRFESQRIAGRNYPWLAPHQIQVNRKIFRRTLSAPDGSIFKDNEIKQQPPFDHSRKTLNVDINNFDRRDEKEVQKEVNFVGNITGDDKLKTSNIVYGYDEFEHPNSPSNTHQSLPDDNLVENINEIKEYLRQTDEESIVEMRQHDPNHEFDRVPSLPAPPIPTSAKHTYLNTLNRLSTFKNMMIFNAETFIKEKIPRIPEGMFDHYSIENEFKNEQSSSPSSPKPFSDETDILLPSRRKVVEGIESDDLVSKFISFLGWVMFLLMRMISLSVFAVFYPWICLWMCVGHYCFMLLCLINETRFKTKWRRSAFYIILSYIYIFNIMEFKIKFKNIRTWYVGYFFLLLGQNIGMTIAWYGYTDFMDTWWFEFMFMVILQSGIMALMCFVLYFFYLKPKDRVLFVNE